MCTKTAIIRGLALVLLIASLRGVSQTAAVESFDYTDGAVLNGLGTAGDGWAGSWFLTNADAGMTDSLFFVVDDSLDYGDLSYPVPTAGEHINSVLPTANAKIRMQRYLSQEWPDSAGRTYWISVVMQVSNAQTVSCWAGISMYDSLVEKMLIGKGWAGNVYSFGNGDPGASEESTVPWDSGAVWLVGRMDLLAPSGSGDVRLHMWVNLDPTAGEPDTADADTKSDYSGMTNGFNSVMLHYGDYGGLSELQFSADEIRLGTSWADVSSDYSGVSEEGTPDELVLDQNYPNPFNLSTNIYYTLKNKGRVRLSVYDVIGQEVAVLVDDDRDAGRHEVKFSGSDLTSGIYFYKLQSANQVVTKKMTLLKK